MSSDATDSGTESALVRSLEFIFIKRLGAVPAWMIQGMQTDLLWKLYLEVLRELGPVLHGVELKLGGAAAVLSLGPKNTA